MVLNDQGIMYAMVIGFIDTVGDIKVIGNIPSGYGIYLNISFVI